MELRLIFQGKYQPPPLADIPQPVFDLSDNPVITMCLVEGGMRSGEPSVIIVSSDATGSAVMQTSLDKLMMAVASMATAAETRWGWRRPDGHASLVGSKEARKALLEAIKKELEEWEEIDNELEGEENGGI